jgi:hypothetical protein
MNKEEKRRRKKRKMQALLVYIRAQAASVSGQANSCHYIVLSLST